MKNSKLNSFESMGTEVSVVDLFTLLASTASGPIGVNLSLTINPASGNIAFGPAPDNSAASENPVVRALMPIFWNDSVEAKKFLDAVDGADSTSITLKVNELLKTGKISKAQCKGNLWRILYDAKIYKYSVQNWNSQVNF